MTPEQSKDIIELFSEPALLVSHTGEIKAANRAIKELLQFPGDDLHRRNIQGLLNQSTNPSHTFLQTCFDKQVKAKGTLVFTGRTGEEIICQGEGTPLTREPGETFTHVFLRLTPQVGKIMPLSAINGKIAELEEKIKKNEEAMEELRERDRQKDQFISLVAHGLRNPIGPVMNGLQVLRMAGSDPQIQDQARKLIERQIHYLTRIINDLLEASRLSRGKIHIQTHPLDLGSTIRSAAEDYRRPIEKAGLSLIVDIPKEPVWVMGDAIRLKQILNHLLDNAIKFTNEGGKVSVIISTNADAKEAAITVRDNGIGIEKDHLTNLFDMFTQAERSRHRTGAGLGIGLTLVKGFTEQHKGKILARSEGPDKGSEFIIQLPMIEEPAATSVQADKPSQTGQNLRIVIIEDNKDAADSLRMLLEFLGHEVRVAYSGPEGVKLAEEWGPAVVLSDIGLPGLDGWGVARELRQHPVTAHTRLIAITAYGMETDRNLSHDAGFEAHLTKPVDINELASILVQRQNQPLPDLSIPFRGPV